MLYKSLIVAGAIIICSSSAWAQCKKLYFNQTFLPEAEGPVDGKKAGVCKTNNIVTCKRVCVRIPSDADVRRIDYYLREKNGNWGRYEHEKQMFNEGVLAYGGWDNQAVHTKQDDEQIVCRTAKNWSHNKDREAKIQVTVDPYGC